MSRSLSANVIVIKHPLVQHKLTLMRDKRTSARLFRQLLNEISMLMAYEISAELPLQEVVIDTPLEQTVGHVIDGKKLVLVSILRAGNGILEGMLSVIPSARVGHIGLYRDPDTLRAIQYYFKMPESIQERDVVIVDPMLATGHSAVAAIEQVKALGPRSIKFVCLVSCQQGITELHTHFPEVVIYTASIDRELDHHAYIRPGLGDAGDRIFGTK